MNYEEIVPPASPESEPGMPMYDKTLAQMKTEAATLGIAGSPVYPTVTELLEMKKANLEHELELVNKALEQREKNNGAMDLIDAISKTRVSSRL